MQGFKDQVVTEKHEMTENMEPLKGTVVFDWTKHVHVVVHVYYK